MSTTSTTQPPGPERSVSKKLLTCSMIPWSVSIGPRKSSEGHGTPCLPPWATRLRQRILFAGVLPSTGDERRATRACRVVRPQDVRPRRDGQRLGGQRRVGPRRRRRPLVGGGSIEGRLSPDARGDRAPGGDRR